MSDTFTGRPDLVEMLAVLDRLKNLRERILDNRFYYVHPNGNDNNEGRTDAPSESFASLQKAIDTVSTLDHGLFASTIKVADGEYTSGAVLKSYFGVGPVTIEGNVTTPEDVLINTTTENIFIATAVSGKYVLSGMKLQTTSGFVVCARDLSNITLNKINFGPATSSYQITSEDGANIKIISDYTIAGGAIYHWLANKGGKISFDGAAHTITIDGTPVFTGSFALAQIGGMMQVNGLTFSGLATGKRYSAILNGVIDTIGGGASYLPGDVAGTTATGGQYA